MFFHPLLYLKLSENIQFLYFASKIDRHSSSLARIRFFSRLFYQPMIWYNSEKNCLIWEFFFHLENFEQRIEFGHISLSFYRETFRHPDGCFGTRKNATARETSIRQLVLGIVREENARRCERSERGEAEREREREKEEENSSRVAARTWMHLSAAACARVRAHGEPVASRACA